MQTVTSKAEYEALLAGAPGRSIFFFWAQWFEPSRQGGALHGSFTALSEKYPSVSFVLVEAEAVPEVSEVLGVSVVPTFVSLTGAKQIERLEGVNPAELAKLVKRLVELPASVPGTVFTAPSSSSTSDSLNQRLDRLINTAPVMLFMKGNPGAPRCGFSKQIVELLQSAQIPFSTFDILQDEEVRAGLKTYSDWPTYPQLYSSGNLVGGLDIVKEMVANEGSEGPLKQQLGLNDAISSAPPAQTLDQRLAALVNRSPVMLFMKGNPNEPKCGFSRQIVEILRQQSVSFDSFDILQDEEVRAGLKTYSDWPTYPQLYASGNLVGGLDIVKEMVEGGPLLPQLQG